MKSGLWLVVKFVVLKSKLKIIKIVRRTKEFVSTDLCSYYETFVVLVWHGSQDDTVCYHDWKVFFFPLIPISRVKLYGKFTRLISQIEKDTIVDSGRERDRLWEKGWKIVKYDVLRL